MLLHRADLLGCNFNPRSHEGSDAYKSAQIPAIADFNPRSHEGSDKSFAIPHATYFYFNPRSHEGSDCANNSLLCSPGHFNPRSHEGSDQAERLKVRQYWYFNPCSHEGSDDILLEFASSMLLFQSTLPRGERQIQVLFPDQIVHFNPRSHEGSDICQPASALPNPISIHAPTRGATCSRSAVEVARSGFQSTLPRGERRLIMRSKLPAAEFQSTLQRGERQQFAKFMELLHGISIHAPTRGATQACTLSCPAH